MDISRGGHNVWYGCLQYTKIEKVHSSEMDVIDHENKIPLQDA